MLLRLPALITMAAIAACSSESGKDGNAVQSTLKAAQARWTQQADSDYAYAARWNCFCPESYTALVDVVVRGDVVDSVRYREVTRMGQVPDPERFRPVEGMFAYVQEAIDGDAAAIIAEYDDERGYPGYVFIDPDDRIADEEYGFAIESFDPDG